MRRRLGVLAPVVLLAACQVSAQIGPASKASSAGIRQPAKMVIARKAMPLPLSDVRLTGGPLKHAQDMDGQYLLSLEPDRMMAFLRKSAGLTPKAEGYGGWDGAGRQLTGHIAGHYLSAVSLMYAATGDARFKQRADYLVSEMKAVQDKQGDGYIGGQLDGQGVDAKVRFQELAAGTIRSGGFDLNGLWSPWYVLHKIYAGLRDAYRFTGNREALDTEIKYAAWAESILLKLDDGQIQRMLGTEFGGMNEVLVDLYADTGDKRWLSLSDRFEHRAIIEPFARGEDILAGKHGNTIVPKMIGELARYEWMGNETDGKAARFFWDRVALHHSFATGGHGRNEYFGEPDKMTDMIEGRTAETCNVYNMIKMARSLFALEPDVKYADFHERALFNHILGSMDPTDGAVCYMVPVGQGVSREYQNMSRDFTCCVGSGMESHSLHGDGLYYESGDKLWVNIYAPSTAEWKAAGVSLKMDTAFPDGDAASLAFTVKSPRRFTLALRRPYWAGQGFGVKVNGVAVKDVPPADSYVEIARSWQTGDKVDLVLPKTLRAEPLPDNPQKVALMWGPLVLAGDLGPVQSRRGGRQGGTADAAAGPRPAPILVTGGRPMESWMKPLTASMPVSPDLQPFAGKPGVFRAHGGRDLAGAAVEVDLVPFYELHRRTYAAYWDLLTPDQWQQRAAAIRAAEEKRQRLEAATVAFAQPGQMQTERDFNQQGESTTPVQAQGRYGRRGTKWFSFDLPADPAHPMTVIVTYAGDERATRTFEVQIDGTKVADQTVERRSPERTAGFFDVEYQVPADLVKGKQKVTVRFQATGGNEIAAVYGIRVVRADR
jgi:DUF1680 family protein